MFSGYTTTDNMCLIDVSISVRDVSIRAKQEEEILSLKAIE
jgi:hypothetical protein